MDDVGAGKVVCGSDLGMASRAAVECFAFVVEGGAGGGVDGTILGKMLGVIP